MNSSLQAMKTVGEVLQLSADFLSQKGIDRPRRQVEELLSHILNLPRIELYLQFDRPLNPSELDRLRSYLKQRAQRMPYQYIIGEVDFFDCTFEITPDVLIPRPETELLVARILQELPAHPVTIWDICCGSGCMGIALKKKRPDCTIILSDLSPKALAIAQKNAARHQIDVEFRQGDLLAPFQGMNADVIVCNPPYISEKEYSSLDPEVRDWEPKMALIAGKSGYEFYERLAQNLPCFLNSSSTLYLEIGTGMGQQASHLFKSAGWARVEVFQDWSSHDRFMRCQFKST